MWARITEVMLGVWLAASPFIFRYPPDGTALMATTYVAALLTIVFALASYRPRLGKAHLLQLPVAVWLLTVAFLQPDPPPGPVYQNFACVSLLLMMFAIIPSRASEPPRAWREFYKRRDTR